MGSPTDDEMRAKLKRLKPQALNTLERYYAHGESAKTIADDERVGVTAIYERIKAAERELGVPFPRQTRRGRPRSAA